MQRKIIFLIVVGLIASFPMPTGAYMDSSHYRIESDVIGGFGHYSTSPSFQLDDTGGEVGTGSSVGSDYGLGAGFWQTDPVPTISLSSSPSNITMGAITGVGKSSLVTNRATFTVFTTSSAGYQLQWQASTAGLMNGSESIDAYVPATANVPEHWNVASTASAWGAHLSSTSTTTDPKWGTDDQSGTNYGTTAKWLNVDNVNPYTIVTNNAFSSPSGDTEIVDFGAEVGAAKLQPNGTYAVTITMTATAL